MLLLMSSNILIAIATLGVVIRFFYNMQQAMNTISPKNRVMDGGMVWLNLVPLLNFVWVFIFNNALQNSYRKEFSERGIREKVDLGSGIVYPVLNLAMFIFPFFVGLLIAEGNQGILEEIEDLNEWSTMIYILFGFGTLVMWIVYWSEVTNLKSKLVLNAGFGQYVQNESVDSGRLKSNTKNVHSSNQPLNKEPKDSSQNNAFDKTKQENISNKNESTVEKIKKYHDMFREGLISEEDFNRIKKQILENKDGR
jgi:hypothetical protein